MLELKDHKTLLRFAALLCLLAGYFFYLSWKYDAATGGMLAALTWSFFVLCTPVADAGFLLDFPVRLLFGIKMIFSEMVVWTIAISLNLWAFYQSPDIYDKTPPTSLLHKILLHPWPYWSIIFLCALGTYVSVYFGDEVYDAVSDKSHGKSQKNAFKYKIGIMAIIFIIVFFVYKHLIDNLGIENVF